MKTSYVNQKEVTIHREKSVRHYILVEKVVLKVEYIEDGSDLLLHRTHCPVSVYV